MPMWTPSEELLDELRDVIKGIRKTIDAATRSGDPINEANTEAAVFDKLLPALGYGHLVDFTKRAPGGVGDIPDYTLLPGSESHKWFLDAKHWGKQLTERDEKQVVTYANTAGSDWAVLSSGLEWRMYRANLAVPLSKKCFSELKSLWDENAPEWLAYLSKDAVLNGELDAHFRRQRLRNWVSRELTDEKSRLIKHLLGRAHTETGLSNVRGVEILTALALQPAQPPEQQADPASSLGQASDSYSLQDLARRPDTATDTTPSRLQLPGRSSINVTSWREVGVEMVKYVIASKPLPSMPFSGQRGGYRYFLATNPRHQKGPEWKQSDYKTVVSTDGQPVHIHWSRSAKDLILRCHALITEVRLDPADFTITFEKKPGHPTRTAG